MKLICVPPDRASEAMPLAKTHIEEALERTDISKPEIVVEDILSGRALLWLAAEGTNVVGAGVTQLIEGRQGKICEIVAWGAHEQSKCAKLLGVIHKYASDEKCSLVRLIGRKGWAKRLPDYKIRALIMEKAI